MVAVTTLMRHQISLTALYKMFRSMFHLHKPYATIIGSLNMLPDIEENHGKIAGW